ncbi:VQ MOTIF-CONTAINING PROTEIN 9 [Salix purpurea]|uniref:VQ MOTIF-CONTAINING PROTEIN 9 n=1 Tax=Salix purpurea TaxID=77065 RepID=A0A9Q0PCI0_SALPP|nr:VQ MOTIF-CONTAINING PROTEIN 9 [Salix purpurea]
MDKNCQSSGDSITGSNSSAHTTTTTATTINSSSRDHYLKHLNKLSHKISKPPISAAAAAAAINKGPFDQPSQLQSQPQLSQPSSQQQQNQNLQGQQQQQQQQQHQPPVYNINKNDFRDVVQKLTGSPAHERFSTPPPIHPPKPQSSRLQRIRPPPLAHVSNRPPPLLNNTMPPPQQPPLATVPNPNPSASATNSFIQRSTAPLSPLPPFPAVHAAAESPVSAYMRCLQNTISAVDSNKQFSGFSPLAPLVSPRWNNQMAPQQQFAVPPPQGMNPSQSAGMAAPQPQFQLPTSPLPFGCMNSPRSPYPLLSPSLLLSPSSFPLAPTLPVSSPRWRGL